MNFLKPPPPGAKPGIKRKISKEENTENLKKKRYEESDRNREFQARWNNDFKSLNFDSGTGLMTCIWCVSYVPGSGFNDTHGSNAFVVGSDNFRRSTLTDHEVTKRHQKVCIITV